MRNKTVRSANGEFVDFDSLISSAGKRPQKNSELKTEEVRGAVEEAKKKVLKGFIPPEPEPVTPLEATTIVVDGKRAKKKSDKDAEDSQGAFGD